MLLMTYSQVFSLSLVTWTSPGRDSSALGHEADADGWKSGSVNGAREHTWMVSITAAESRGERAAVYGRGSWAIVV